MTLPSGGASQSFAVIIDMLLKGDADAKAKLEAIEKEALQAKKTLGDFSTSQLESIKKLAEAEEQRARDFAKNNQLIIREIRAQVAEISKRSALLRSTANDIDRFAKPLQLGGALVVGGIFAAASKYVNDAKVATATTIQWKAAQDSLNRSGERIGEVLAREALPILQEAAEVTRKIAQFLSANPEIAGAALKGGLLALTLGTLGKAVSSGIRLYADLKMDAALALQFQAAELQLAAAKTQLQAAGLQSGGGGIAAPAKGGSLLALGPLAAILAGAASFAAIGKTAANSGAKAFGFESPEAFWEQMLQKLGLVKNAADSASDSLGDFGTNLDPSKFLGGTEEAQAQLLSAYEKYKQEDLAAVKQHHAERQSIISDALASERAATSNFVKNVGRITKSINDAILKAAEDFNKANLQAEQDYARNRADIIQQGNQDIQRIEEDSQDRLRKLQQDFEDKTENARNRRDALALRDAGRDLNRGRAEEIANTNKEIARRRQDIALRLRELDSQFAQERQRRLEDYQQRVAELEAQKKEQIAEATAAHAEEISRIRQQTADKLRQLDAAFIAEQEHRRDALIAQIRNVDAALLGESNLRQQYQAQMLTDLETFLAQYKSRLGSLGGSGSTSGSVPTRDAGGYVQKGIYRMAWDGNKEFVLSGASTRAMEKIVGGQLNQQNVTQAARGGAGGQMVLHYNARFDGEVTAAMRRAVQKDTEATISKFLKSSLVGA